MPTRNDVDLARTAIDRGFLTIKESIRCLEIQRDYENNGRQVPLESIFVETKLLTEQQLATLKESLARTNALRRIGAYEIMSKVGAGGMGTVYKAKDKKADRIVALKVLSPAHVSNKEYIQRFLREAHASGQLSHPNIVQGYDAGEADGQYYFAMEFVDGVTVASMLKDTRPIPEQQALDIAIQIGKALQHAEEHGLIHRDVKPDNIMLTEDGAAKLADLGLARLTNDPTAHERRSFGTAYYASPEQCEGIEELDTKSDMYSFGATLFHMLSGRVPFDGDTPESIMTKHLEDKRPYLKDLNVQLSHGVSKIVRKLMARNKRERYDNMADVVTDLTLVRMGRSPRLGRSSRYDAGEYRYRSETGSWRTKPTDRRKMIVQVAACIGVGVAMLVVGVLVFNWALRAPDIPEPQAKRPPAKQGPPPRPEHQIYLEDLLERRSEMPPDVFAGKLQTVVDDYAGSSSARRAKELLEEIAREREAQAQETFKRIAAEVAPLRESRHYQQAIDKLQAFPKAYEDTPQAREIAALKTAIEDQAQADYETVRRQATALADENKFDEAVELYTTMKDAFGMASIDRRADSFIADVRSRQARLAEEVRRQEEERAKKVEQEQLAIREGFTEARSLIRESDDLDAAAEKLRLAIDAAFTEGTAEHLARAADDLAAAGELIQALRASGGALKEQSVAIRQKDGTELVGTVFSVAASRLVLLLEGGAMTTVNWDDITPASIVALVNLNNSTLSPERRAALATYLYFAGEPVAASAVLDQLATEEDGKAVARLRRGDFTFFSEIQP